MKSFLLKIAIFFVLPILATVLWVLIYGFPPPNLSQNVGFNAKMLSIKNNKPSAPLDVLAIGSSMSLNNIYSESIATNLGDNYLNFSSWGQNVEDDYKLIKIFKKRFKPKMIIMSGNYMDFNKNPKGVKFESLEEYLADDSKSFYSGMGFRHFLLEARIFHEDKRAQHSYNNLLFDEHGGVTFPKDNFEIMKLRWDGYRIKKFVFDSAQYQYLDSLANFCNANGIYFSYIQSPFREGYLASLEDEERISLANHIHKVSTVLKKNNILFVNTTTEVWPDSLYVDYSHFNNIGCKKYTDLFVSQIKADRASKGIANK